MNSSFPAYVDMISPYSPSHINAWFHSKNVFRLTFRYYLSLFSNIQSLARLGTSFICIWIKRDRQNALI